MNGKEQQKASRLREFAATRERGAFREYSHLISDDRIETADSIEKEDSVLHVLRYQSSNLGRNSRRSVNGTRLMGEPRKVPRINRASAKGSGNPRCGIMQIAGWNPSPSARSRTHYVSLCAIQQRAKHDAFVPTIAFRFVRLSVRPSVRPFGPFDRPRSMHAYRCRSHASRMRRSITT